MLSPRYSSVRRTLVLAGVLVSGLLPASGQVFVVGREHPGGIPEFKQTSVQLEQKPLIVRTRQELIAAFTAEQGFARRPLPFGAHGLVLHANGPLSPGGDSYEATLQRVGISSKAGDRLVITEFVIGQKSIIFDFNGGPVHKHAILRHISIGAGGGSVPLARDDGTEPTGSRLTLVFDKYVPEMTPEQLRALIKPVIDFDIKTPAEAYADTLPPKIKKAILDHEVLVGMDRKMVIYAVGQPTQKVREQEHGATFEEWIYGEAPKPTEFVRFQGSRVTRLEIASVGEPPVIRDTDETDGYLGETRTRAVYVGDARPSATGDTAPARAPSLRLPGEALPQSPVQPVRMPDGSSPAPAPIPPPPEQAPGH